MKKSALPAIDFPAKSTPSLASLRKRMRPTALTSQTPTMSV